MSFFYLLGKYLHSKVLKFWSATAILLFPQLHLSVVLESICTLFVSPCFLSVLVLLCNSCLFDNIHTHTIKHTHTHTYLPTQTDTDRQTETRLHSCTHTLQTKLTTHKRIARCRGYLCAETSREALCRAVLPWRSSSCLIKSQPLSKQLAVEALALTGWLIFANYQR